MDQDLIITKIQAPPLRPQLVQRPRLIHQLDKGLRRGCGLALVSAPAGFGKTTLVRQWLHETGCTFAWFSCDEEDNDPFRFWRYLTAALQTTGKGVGGAVESALCSPEPLQLEALIAILINDITTLQTPVALILDDFQTVNAAPIYRSLNLLLDHAPPNLWIVVITRADPPLSLGRRRAGMNLVEIRAADMRFTNEEATRFLQASAGLDLSSEAIDELHKRTEGWVVGLQLAALSLQRREDKLRFVRSFAGDDSFVMDYLVEEVLQQQPPHVRDFLLQTSILGRMCASLCDALTGRNDGQLMLSSLVQSNIFLEPLDNCRVWCRYHRLFSELLRHRLHLSMGLEQVMFLHRRASEWFERNGYVSEAIAHSLEADDIARAADLVERYGLAMVFRCGAIVMSSWMKRLPEDIIRSRPLLCAIHAWGLLFALAPPELVENRLTDAENGRHVVPDEGSGDVPRNEILSHVATIRSYLARIYAKDPKAAIELSFPALGHFSESSHYLRSAVLINRGLSYLMLGNIAESKRAFIEVEELTQASGNYYFALISLHRQAYIASRQGRLHEAASICRKALRTIIVPALRKGEPVPFAGAIYVQLGSVLLEWNDLEEAERALTKGLELLRPYRGTRIQVEGHAAYARLKQARGDLAGAINLLEQAKPLWHGAEPYARSMQTRLRLLHEGYDPTLLDLDEVGVKELWPDSEHDGQAEAIDIDIEGGWRHAEQLNLVRLLIAKARASSAVQRDAELGPLISSLERRIQIVREFGLAAWTQELLLQKALALSAMGDFIQALASLKRALAQAQSGGYTRIFVDEGPPMARLLSWAFEKGAMPKYTARLLAAFPKSELPPEEDLGDLGLQPELCDPVSMREIEVLELIAEGLSNQQIAERLVISLGTVKVHTHNMFGKLRVHSRTQAVAKAKALGILSSP